LPLSGSGRLGGNERANVLDAVQNVSTILTGFVSGSSDVFAGGAPELALEALKFLIHFVGDMHQPLHLCGRDRGGNSDKVTFDGRVTNLHAVWDKNLIAKALRQTPKNYSRPLPVPAVESSLRGAIYDPYVRRVVWEGIGIGKGHGRWESEVDSWLSCGSGHKSLVHGGQEQPAQQALFAGKPKRPKGSGPPETSDTDTLCPYAWATPIHALNCAIVWPAELDNPGSVAPLGGPRKDYLELDTAEYAGQIEKEWIIEKLLAEAGVRLAGILNHIFLPQQLEGELQVPALSLATCD